jgi:serine/threonine-protein kinase RsbW
MELSLALTLPRDEQTVPVARHVVRNAMDQAGVEATCVYDLELALSEACTNVLLHSGPGDQYIVRLDMEDEIGRIRVVDVGHGFDSARLQAGDALPEAERGRGLGLMRALVDRVRGRYQPNQVVALAAPGDREAPAEVALLADRPMVAGRATAYVCEHFVCRRPVTDPGDLAELLEN